MKKINKSKCMGMLLVVLIVWSAVSLIILEDKRQDALFMETWSISTEREAFIENVSRYYFPFELLSYALGLYFMYMLFYGWTNELFDGKLLKTIPYFIMSIFGGIYSLNAYTGVSRVRNILWSKGIIAPMSMLISPFIVTLVLGIGIYLLRLSIQKDFYKEVDALKGSTYYNKWLEMSEKVKDII